MPEPVEIFEKEYYDRLKAVEGNHWWTLGMTDIMDRLLGDELPRLVSARGETKFLDIGCGSGIGLAWGAKNLPEAKRFGIDVSQYAIDYCQGLGADVQLAGADALPFEDASMDLAICIDVLQHLEDDGKALLEAFRVLKPGGLLFIRTNAKGLTQPPTGSNLYTQRRLIAACEYGGLRVRTCSRVNLVGGLFAELGNLTRRASGGHGHGGHGHGGHGHGGHGHGGHGHGEHGEDSNGEHASKDGPFKGGGYGGGLRITPDGGKSLASRLKRQLLRQEGGLIQSGWTLPFGHSLVCLAEKPA